MSEEEQEGMVGHNRGKILRLVENLWFRQTGKITHRDFVMQEDKEMSTQYKKFAKISEEQGMIGHNRGKILRLVENFEFR